MTLAHYITTTKVAEIANWRNLPEGHVVVLTRAEAEHPLRLGQIKPYTEPAVVAVESDPEPDAGDDAKAEERAPSTFGKRRK
jgi:hypothetical protein